MTSDDALDILRMAATAILALPIDDDRVPGLARDLARAALVLDEAMQTEDVPLDWVPMPPRRH